MIEFGDCRDIMRRWASEGVKVQMCVTSPPYFGLRDYNHEGQIGLEQTPEEYIESIVNVFRCVRDVLSDDGTIWLNLGDSYGNGKQLHGIPWRVALALQADGWVLRQDIIWHKPNPMPESVRDRCTKAHEYIFLLSKSDKYYFDNEAIKQPVKQDWGTRNRKNGKYHNEGTGLQPHSGLEKSYTMANKRSVWTVTTKPYKGAHFATFPPDLIEPCILAGSRPYDVVLDPFMGSGTTAQVAIQHGRKYLGCELNPAYQELQCKRIAEAAQNASQIDIDKLIIERGGRP
jgi:DNA modification methylase